MSDEDSDVRKFLRIIWRLAKHLVSLLENEYDFKSKGK